MVKQWNARKNFDAALAGIARGATPAATPEAPSAAPQARPGEQKDRQTGALSQISDPVKQRARGLQKIYNSLATGTSMPRGFSAPEPQAAGMKNPRPHPIAPGDTSALSVSFQAGASRADEHSSANEQPAAPSAGAGEIPAGDNLPVPHGWSSSTLSDWRELAQTRPGWQPHALSALASLPPANAAIFLRHCLASPSREPWKEEAIRLFGETTSIQKMKALLPLLANDFALLREAMPKIRKWNAEQCALFDLSLRAGKKPDQALFRQISRSRGEAQAMLPFASLNLDWAMAHAEKIDDMGSARHRIVLELAQLDFDLTAQFFPQFGEALGIDLLVHILECAQRDESYLGRLDIGQLVKDAPETAQDRQQFFIEQLNQISAGKDVLLNPYLRKHPGDIADFPLEAGRLKQFGVSRTVLEKNRQIKSVWSERFAENQRLHPEITLGYEGEMFVPGRHGFDPTSAQSGAELNQLGGVSGFVFRGDSSLQAAGILDKGFEINRKFSQPDSAAALQNLLSWLNEANAHTNQSTGEHWHIGVSQYTAAGLLAQACEAAPASINPHLAAWDTPPGSKTARVSGAQTDHDEPTPLELLVMSQFAANMMAVEDSLASVQRRSMYARPNAGADLSPTLEALSQAKTFSAVKRILQPGGRDYVVNLESYQKGRLKTLEFRGFTNRDAEFMDVDATLPVINMVFMQQVMILTKQQVLGHLSTGAAPADPLVIAPHAAMVALGAEYVQDVLAHKMIHALQMDKPGKRKRLMEKLLAEDRARIPPATIAAIGKAYGPYLQNDRQARNFLDVMQGRAPGPVDADQPSATLKRQLSGRHLSNRFYAARAADEEAAPAGEPWSLKPET